MILRRKLLPYCLSMLLFPAGLHAERLFDAHLHYNAADAAHYSPEEIIARLDRNGIERAVVTGSPAAHTANLYRHAPGRIVPMLGVYRQHTEKMTWPDDASLPERVAASLEKGDWHGIGELHIFAKDRHSPVFRDIIRLAAQRELPVQLHADPAVIDTVYDIAPGLTVIWAHAGTYPYPDLVADYLQRYPSLYVDLSVRDSRIAPDGILDDAWYELFIRFPGRFLIGVDTYSLLRWHAFDLVVTDIRQWLAQLPDDVAARLAYENAAGLFPADRLGKD